MGNIPGTNIFECIDTCQEVSFNIRIIIHIQMIPLMIILTFIKQAKQFKGIRIVRYEESLYYANVDNFKYRVNKEINIKPEIVLKKINSRFLFEMKKLNCKTCSRLEIAKKVDQQQKDMIYDSVKKDVLKDLNIKHIILDCSCFNYIDSQGIQAILSVIIFLFCMFDRYNDVKILFYF